MFLNCRPLQLQKDYKTFIRTVATLIARDAGVNRDNSLTNRIDVFVDDVFKVESKIATVRIEPKNSHKLAVITW